MSPPRKRRRRRRSIYKDDKPQPPPPSTPAQPPNPNMDKHTLFTLSALSAGLQIHSVTPSTLPGRGIGLTATAPISKGERLILVPEKAMFKPDLSLLKSHGLDPRKISPQAQLTFSLMHALAKAGEDSHLRKWAATWPTIQDLTRGLPFFWDEDQRGMLPPSAGVVLERQTREFERDAAAVKGAEGFEEGWMRGRDDPGGWAYYWFVVNSRSFYFKPPGAKPGSVVLCPFVDYLNHGPTGSGCDVRQTSKGYEVVADRDYDDDVRLDHLILPSLNADQQQRLTDVGYLGSYALVPSTNSICFRTQVAVRLVVLTSKDWEYYIANGEDRREGHAEKVNNWLLPLINSYRQDTLSKLELSQGMLKTRWTQILGAVDNFLEMIATQQ